MAHAKALRCFFYYLIFAVSPAFAASVNLAWDAPVDTTGIAGYRIGYGTQSGSYLSFLDAGNSLTATVTGLSDGTTYFFAVLDYPNGSDTAHTASVYSNEVSATTPFGAPNASFSASPSSGTAPLTVVFNNLSSGNITSYAWAFGDGGTATPPNTSHTYASAGSFGATLTVSGPGGSSTSPPSTIIVSTTGNESLFTSQTPALLHNSDGVNYELGMRFSSTSAGQITALKFWKDSSETGSHTGRLWNVSGQLLASVVFSGESASGWQTANLAAPYSITANTEYMVTVNTGAMYYVATNNGLDSAIVSGHLASIVGSNGRFGPVGQYPTNTWNGSNYFRDAVFVAGSSPPPDTIPPVVTISSPANGTVFKHNRSNVSVSASATDNVGVTSMSLAIDGTTVSSVTGSALSYTWNIHSAVVGQHTLAVTAKDAAGNAATKTITVTRQ